MSLELSGRTEGLCSEVQQKLKVTWLRNSPLKQDLTHCSVHSPRKSLIQTYWLHLLLLLHACRLYVTFYSLLDACDLHVMFFVITHTPAIVASAWSGSRSHLKESHLTIDSFKMRSPSHSRRDSFQGASIEAMLDVLQGTQDIQEQADILHHLCTSL